MQSYPSEDPLPTPHELKRELPSTDAHLRIVTLCRHTIKNILEGTDPRQLIIVGPCSVHDTKAAKEYALLLAELSRRTADKFFIVMRAYYEKPRTTSGWKGMLYDPFLDGSGNILAGLRLTRQLLLDLTSLGIGLAAEFLNPIIVPYVSDLISWGCIGARTVESQIHRQLASALSIPVGIKNNTDGNLDVAINAIITAGASHSYLTINEWGQIINVRTLGNKHTHLILRGAEEHTNYDPNSVQHALTRLQKSKQPERVMIDCSHGNSWKQHARQQIVFESAINQIVEGNNNIIGMMLESNIYEGNQTMSRDPSLLRYGISLTDPCLDWNSTSELILWGYNQLSLERTERQKEFSLSSSF
jgi:3-deoxy-7-phosphoheptulonate synthase